MDSYGLGCVLHDLAHCTGGGASDGGTGGSGVVMSVHMGGKAHIIKRASALLRAPSRHLLCSSPREP